MNIVKVTVPPATIEVELTEKEVRILYALIGKESNNSIRQKTGLFVDSTDVDGLYNALEKIIGELRK